MPGGRVSIVAQAGAAGLMRDGRGILLRALLPLSPQGVVVGGSIDEMGVSKKEDSAHRCDAGATHMCRMNSVSLVPAFGVALSFSPV